MSVKCQTIINLIEQIAPRSLAEDWDNVGLQVGDRSGEVSAVMLALDLTPQVLGEAVSKGANLIITHHPVIFKPMKNIRTDLALGKMVLDIIKSDISVYSAHTNLDSASDGVNQVLAQLLQLQEIQILSPDKYENLFKIVVFVPETHIDVVRSALTDAGAGWIGNYSDCTFSVKGVGTFKAREGSNPFLGEVGVLERTPEIRLETVVKEKQVNKVIQAMIDAHPYEEVAYDVYPLANRYGQLGLGRIGRLKEPVNLGKFLDLVKDALGISALRFCGNKDSVIRKVAVCGGSGAGFIHKASFAGADVLLTGDVKYHEAQEAVALGLSLIDAGHFATENPIINKLAEMLTKACVRERLNIPIYVSSCSSDIFSYY